MLLTYGLRWYPSSFNICDEEFPSCHSVTATTLLINALCRFYLWWIVLYYIWIFVFLGSYIESRSFKTLYDRVAGIISFSSPNLLRKSNEISHWRRLSLWVQPSFIEKGSIYVLSCTLWLFHHDSRLPMVAILVGPSELHPHHLHMFLLQRIQTL